MSDIHYNFHIGQKVEAYPPERDMFRGRVVKILSSLTLTTTHIVVQEDSKIRVDGSSIRPIHSWFRNRSGKQWIIPCTWVKPAGK